MGFRRAGQHRSKAVTRWRQGDINLVVNSEKEGFAHSFNIVHGSAVCALGLTRRRTRPRPSSARPCCSTSRSARPSGPGELDIPAVRGVGGSLVYFLDSRRATSAASGTSNSTPTGEPPATTPACTRVDHISQSMQYEEMLTWLLFYTSLLDLEKMPAQDVADPGGLVRSQVIEAADGGLRIVLNASQSQRTQSSRFLTELFGSGVQHIAFATDDLLATVRAARDERRAPAADPGELLRRPRGQDRPAARPADDLLQAHNILYDREGDAEYLQVYTETFDQRFFFEIVERRGYRGYGAANAPVRLAAQARLATDAP